MPVMRKAVFFTRDAILASEARGHQEEARVQFAVGAGTALPLLFAAGYKLVVISNEPGVARGYFRHSALGAMETGLKTLSTRAGVRLTGCYFCPHDPSGAIREYAHDCRCRIPRAGLLHQASLEHRIDLSASWLVGDLLDDVEAAHAAGAHAALIDDGRELEWRTDDMRHADAIANDLAEAALIIASWARGGIRA